MIVTEVDGEVAGYAASVRFHERPAYEPSVMTSVYLSPAFVGKGIGEKRKGTQGLWLGRITEPSVHQIARKTTLQGNGSAARSRLQNGKIPRRKNLRTSFRIKAQLGNKSATKLCSSESSATEASIFSRAKSLTGTSGTMDQLFPSERIGKDVIRPSPVA